MTEAFRPAPRIGTGLRPVPDDHLGPDARRSPGAGSSARPRTVTAPRAAATPRTKARSEPRRPVHLAVAIGFSAGAYALALAGVTGLQSASERALVADRDPTAEALDLMQEHHDRLDARLTAAGVAYDRAAAAYDRVTSGLGSLESRLGVLAGQVAAVQGSAAWTPPVWHAPSVSQRAARSSGSTAHATTCASGKTCP